MSSTSLTRSTRKLPSGFLYNENFLLKKKGLVYKIVKLLFTLEALKLRKKAPDNKISHEVSANNYFSKYGRLFKKNGTRVPNAEPYPHQKFEETLKLLLSPAKMGSFLHGIKKGIEKKNKEQSAFERKKIKDNSEIDMANKIIGEIQEKQQELLNPEPLNTTRTFHSVNRNLTGTDPVHSMFNDMTLDNEDEVKEGGLHNVKRSFRNSTRKAKRRSMSRR